MTQAVTHGADSERLVTVATELGRQADRTVDVAMTGSGSMTVLLQAWDGADAEPFAREAARQRLDAAAAHLQAAARLLRAQGDDQGATSAGGTTTAEAGPGGGPTLRR